MDASSKDSPTASGNQTNSGRRPLVITDDQSQILKQIRNNLIHVQTEDKRDVQSSGDPASIEPFVNTPAINTGLLDLSLEDINKMRQHVNTPQSRHLVTNGYTSPGYNRESVQGPTQNSVYVSFTIYTCLIVT